jgi:hypothetical protein
MATKKKRSGAGSVGKPIEFGNPDVILFAGEDALPVGAIRQHSLSGIVGHIFGREKEDVEAE